MNHRSRPLLDLCYSFDCLLRVDGVCTGGVGEPCHANWPEHGKGGAMKAHDCYAVPGCRACHMWLDQGGAKWEDKYHVWTTAFWKYLAMLWNRGLVVVALQPRVDSGDARPPAERATKRRKNRRTTASGKTFPRPAGGFA